MDNFNAIYKMLKTLEGAMDFPEFDINQINHEKMGISCERWARYIEMMSDIGLIKGAGICRDIMGETCIDGSDIRITLKGLEYLAENPAMQKLYKAAKGIKDITPWL